MTDVLKRRLVHRDAHRGKTMTRHREKTTRKKPRREALEESNLIDTLMLGSSLQNSKKINFWV